MLHRIRTSCLLATLVVVLALAWVGCDRGAETPGTPPAKDEASIDAAPGPSELSLSDQSEIRLVSLSPAITRTLVDFGAGDWIVGRSPFCEGIDPSIAVAGDLLEIDYEMIIRLAPTQVLVQPPSTGTDRRLSELADEGAFALGTWRLNGIDDIRGLVRGVPRFITRKGPERDRLTTRSRELIAGIDEALALRPAWSGRTLMVSGTDPVLVYGVGSYLGDVLESLGGRNASNAVGWATLSLEDVARLDPQAIVLVRAGVTKGDALSNLGPLATLDVAAIRDGRVGMVRSRGADTPSSAIIETAHELASILDGFAEAKE